MTRRGLIRVFAVAATAAQSGWPNIVCQSKDKDAPLKGSWTSLQPRSMFLSFRSPHVQILCSVGGTRAGKIKTVKVNDELIPCFSKAATPGSHWKCDTANLVIYVEERVVDFDLSRFPDVQVC